VRVEAGAQAVVTGTFAFPSVSSWSYEAPNLYPLTLGVYAPGEDAPADDLTERVGFRTVALVGRALLVNGERVFLRGFNRHEDHPTFGVAIPVAQMVRDLQLKLAAGANAVRTSHYPNDERFLDLCDELGVYVWEENHARGLSLEQMQHPNFAAQCEACNREMVESHLNHPAIVIWGVLNECASHTEVGRPLRRQLEQLRRLDDSRLLKRYLPGPRRPRLLQPLLGVVHGRERRRGV